MYFSLTHIYAKVLSPLIQYFICTKSLITECKQKLSPLLFGTSFAFFIAAMKYCLKMTLIYLTKVLFRNFTCLVFQTKVVPCIFGFYVNSKLIYNLPVRNCTLRARTHFVKRLTPDLLCILSFVLSQRKVIKDQVQGYFAREMIYSYPV